MEEKVVVLTKITTVDPDNPLISSDKSLSIQKALHRSLSSNMTNPNTIYKAELKNKKISSSTICNKRIKTSTK